MAQDTIGDRIAICELKARYCRLLDTKQWDDWADLFTDDFVLDTSAAGGPPPITGPTAALAMVRGMLETAITVHQVHQPEISFDGDSAQAIWAMQDRLVFGDGTRLSGFGHYTERYVRQGDHWKIASSALTRLHLDVTPPT
jgi:hypothetical protein